LTYLSSVDLVVDSIYIGGRKGNSADDPLPALIGVDNGAGFRHLGSRQSVSTLRLLALKTSLADRLWPDTLDRSTGLFIYFGDNRTARELHDTPRQGNRILRDLFAEAHSPSRASTSFPPILVFGNAGTHRDVRFLGLAVPGAIGMSSDEDLVAIWRADSNQVRFQNYRAVFTILNIPVLPRLWIKDAQVGRAADSPHAPKIWLDWVRKRRYDPLVAPAANPVRTRQEQTPTGVAREYVDHLFDFFKRHPHDFEVCAVELSRFILPDIHTVQVTRPWRDGGRDATGLLRIGRSAGEINVDFALEAKLYNLDNAVGVREVSRLISRLRYRQFGIMVTTSYLHKQAYEEIVTDGHPIVVLSASDIGRILAERFPTRADLNAWLCSLIPDRQELSNPLS
jgi:hypothetical protein